MTLLCYCVQIDLPVQLEIETLFIILAFVLIYAGCGFVSLPRVFLRSLFRSNVLLWESLLLLRDITGEAVLEPWAV